jgi:hypothetical protein
MKPSKWLGAAALGAGMLTGSGLSAPPAQAAFIVTLDQVGSNVVATEAEPSTWPSSLWTGCSSTKPNISERGGYSYRA